ncbi:MAG: haloacid dehalogenase-like hydrolase [Candidatus Omnitrophica bacterium]|nr:haloacid dehalogenase-like hydrolase [Candidatus Omnitrophota bacterium]
MKFKHNIIAICYDFDGTLSRRSMQEDTIFSEYGINRKLFWDKVNRIAKTQEYDKVLAYLNMLIYDKTFRANPLTEKKLGAMANRIEYFPGVESFFPYINDFIRRHTKDMNVNIKLEHYIISSGMKAILNGVSIRKYFKQIYACDYEYEKDGSPKCVKLAITDTTKTQFLFRVSKGKLELNQDINKHMDPSQRRIPFANMIYVGDGDSDIPSMTVTVKYGGYAVAVYPPGQRASKKCIEMLHEKRTNHIAPADFRVGSELTGVIETILKTIVQKIIFNHSVFTQKQKYSK